jgi:uncharacterized protein YbaP (TraB family)
MRLATAILRSAGVAAVTLVGCFCGAACGADQAPQSLDEIVVTAERAGPGMWHVHKDAANVWLLGSVAPLPRDITWRSKQVENVLESASQVLVQKPIEISIPRILWMLIADRKYLMVPGGKKLKDVMPPELHGRFALQRHRVGEDDDKWERYRPIIAAAFLQQEAFHQANLSMRLDLGAALRKLAEKHGVRVEEVKIAGASDMLEALKTLRPDTERICVEASLTTVESGLPRLSERADAWSNGDVERIEKLSNLKEVDACRAAIDQAKGVSDFIGRIRQTWLEAIEKYLRSPGTTIAVVNLDLMLEKGGLLDQLKALGYEVDAPGSEATP